MGFIKNGKLCFDQIAAFARDGTTISSFDDFAAIKLVVEASGAVENLTMLEAIDFGKATAKASKIGYKGPGQ